MKIVDPLRYKTVKCRNYLRDGKCNYGDKCQFIHEESERREIQEIKYCNHPFRSTCPFGMVCRFNHLYEDSSTQCVECEPKPTLYDEFPLLQTKDPVYNHSTDLLLKMLTTLLEES